TRPRLCRRDAARAAALGVARPCAPDRRHAVRRAARGARGHLRAVSGRARGEHLQPVHLLPLLKMDAPSDREATTMQRVASRGLAALFVVSIAVACLGTIVGLDTGRVSGENRKLAGPPDWNAPLKQIPRQIDAWFDDHFGLRNSLVSLHGAVGYALGASSSKDVVVGRKGWLFYAADRIIESRLGI